MRRHVTVETNRGRRERRECTVSPAPQSLHGLADPKTLVMVLRITQVDSREQGEISVKCPDSAEAIPA